jgi:ribosome-binding protein aMBF1 (putative translation factor)
MSGDDLQPMTPLARALREAMQNRGLTPADLIHELGQPEATVRNVIDGRVARPNRTVRDAIDRYFDAPAATLAIADGRMTGYPNNRLSELVQLAQPLPGEAVEHLVGFLRAIS